MNNRERFIATALGEERKRIALYPGDARRATVEAWKKQGLAEDAVWEAELAKAIGLDQSCLQAIRYAPSDFELRPTFEEKVLERKERTQIVQDIHGNVVEISNAFDVTMLRAPVGFVTRRWISCPVSTRDDWEAMKTRYLYNDPARVTEEYIQTWKELQQQNDAMVELWFNGLFWQMREWMGFETLCLAFYDDEEMIDDMLSYYGEFVSRLLERVLPLMKPDCVHVGEDMAYKLKPMISPEVVEKKFVPIWRQWADIVHANGVKVYEMDSDGYVGDLIPAFIRGGFDMVDPMEIAAGNDMPEMKQRFGSSIAFMGGVDKRIMAKGGEALRNYMEYIRPVVEAGRFIPSCDHGIPDDVSWEHMIEYTALLAEITGWR